jgi:type IX secretion system PorP/SprF family membrane protein
MRKTLLILLFFNALCNQQTKAQDPRFSQFYASPWTLNPAMTGVFNGQWRLAAIYRDQWSSIIAPQPFRTYSAAFDLRVPVGEVDYAAFGIGAMHDEAGVARFSQNKAHIGGSFIKQLAGGSQRTNHFLSAGAQLGFGQHSLDWGRLWFSRQFDPNTETPNTGLGNGEPAQNGNTNTYLDFNAGLLYYNMFGTEGGSFYLGAAMHHLNQPNVSFTGNNGQTLYRRWTAMTGAQLPVNEHFAWMPAVMVMQQGPSFETNAGMNIRYSNNDVNELALRAGAWARIGNRLNDDLLMDAIILTGMVEWNKMVIGLSYDLTVSSLASSNSSRGAFELSFIYMQPGNRKGRIQCPEF